MAKAHIAGMYSVYTTPVKSDICCKYESGLRLVLTCSSRIGPGCVNDFQAGGGGGTTDRVFEAWWMFYFWFRCSPQRSRIPKVVRLEYSALHSLQVGVKVALSSVEPDGWFLQVAEFVLSDRSHPDRHR